mmetsp:Transcript_20331/g.26349  ORF Transcript_20331/g.26349 Transcript_20331/m.26349 type:complete len:269 (+) Transcript_20331:114-920(+)
MWNFLLLVELVDIVAPSLLVKENIGFSFTPSGLAFPYGLGVASKLKENGLINEKTGLAGASGGALVAAVTRLELQVDECIDAALRVNAYCRERGSARFQLRPALLKELNALICEDAADRLSYNGLGIAVLRFQPLPRAQLITYFKDNTDLKSALLATSCIPFYFSYSPFELFRGTPAIDGFFATPRNQFGAPDVPNATKTIRISPFYAPDVGIEGPTICPASRNDLELSTLLSCALGNPPASDSFLRSLFELGCHDAQTWLDDDDTYK